LYLHYNKKKFKVRQLTFMNWDSWGERAVELLFMPGRTVLFSRGVSLVFPVKITVLAVVKQSVAVKPTFKPSEKNAFCHINNTSREPEDPYQRHLRQAEVRCYKSH
jgi:hypothetical protein